MLLLLLPQRARLARFDDARSGVLSEMQLEGFIGSMAEELPPLKDIEVGWGVRPPESSAAVIPTHLCRAVQRVAITSTSTSPSCLSLAIALTAT